MKVIPIVPIFRPFQYLPKEAIEQQAKDVLQSMAKTPNYAPKWPLDASRVAEFLGLDVVWDQIPADAEGMIAARIIPLERLIEINEDIPRLRGGFGESTIAHEIGHWLLHINWQGVDQAIEYQRQGHYRSVKPLLCRNDLCLKGIEWQAQYFATCLLMPRQQLEILRQDKDLSDWRDLYNLAAELGVTISNLIHRLKDLGWIYRQENSKVICLTENQPIL
jgi:Zn-dependent peptidase ImmA (M78 family)